MCSCFGCSSRLSVIIIIICAHLRSYLINILLKACMWCAGALNYNITDTQNNVPQIYEYYVHLYIHE